MESWSAYLEYGLCQHAAYVGVRFTLLVGLEVLEVLGQALHVVIVKLLRAGQRQQETRQKVHLVTDQPLVVICGVERQGTHILYLFLSLFFVYWLVHANWLGASFHCQPVYIIFQFSHEGTQDWLNVYNTVT